MARSATVRWKRQMRVLAPNSVTLSPDFVCDFFFIFKSKPPEMRSLSLSLSLSSQQHRLAKRSSHFISTLRNLMESEAKVDVMNCGMNDLISSHCNGYLGRAPNKQPFIIGVAGGTASGKTTVCEDIISWLHDQRVVLIHQDSFYHSPSDETMEKIHAYNFDHPDAFDTELLLSCVGRLTNGQGVDIPNYDYKAHKNTGSSRKVNPSDVIILEGILVLHDSRVRDCMNMKIFVDTNSDLRLARRIQRDTVERGRNIQNVLDQYAKFVKPSFEEFILPSKKYADIIIPRGGDNNVAVDLIVQHIRTKLGQHGLCKIYPNVFLLHSTFQIRGMHTLIRDTGTKKHDFVFYADRLIRLVVEHGLGHLPFAEKQVFTSTGSV